MNNGLIKHRQTMYTPKELKQLERILSEESTGLTLSVREYVNASLADKPFHLTSHLRLSTMGKLEVTAPTFARAWDNRLKTRELIRTLVRCSMAGIPLGNWTKDWMSRVIRASDYRREAEQVMAKGYSNP